MLSAPPNPIARARSSMEEMLESLRKQDEDVKAKDTPPALPCRPKPASRARLPSPRRPRLKIIENGECDSSQSSSNVDVEKEDRKGLRGNSFVANRVKEWENVCERRTEEKERPILASAPLDLHPRYRESEWDETGGYFVEKVGAFEEAKNKVSKSTLAIQKCFRGHRARLCFHKLKAGTITLQSFIRGEISRRKHFALLKSNEHVADEMPDKRRISVVKLQSAIRRWLAQRQLGNLRNSRWSTIAKMQVKKISEFKDMPPEILPLVVEELQKKIMKVESVLGQKEKENAALRLQLRQFEARWSEYEAKMKSLEEAWQKHTASLQTSLAAAKMSLRTDNNADQPASTNASSSPCCYSFEDMFVGTKTPGDITAIKLAYKGSDVHANSLAKEFEQTKTKFDDDTKAIVDVTSSHSSAIDPEEELERLKYRFRSWKKDYRVRLRDAKAIMQRLRQDEAKKSRPIWWAEEDQNILAF